MEPKCLLTKFLLHAVEPSPKQILPVHHAHRLYTWNYTPAPPLDVDEAWKLVNFDPGFEPREVDLITGSLIGRQADPNKTIFDDFVVMETSLINSDQNEDKNCILNLSDLKAGPLHDVSHHGQYLCRKPPLLLTEKKCLFFSRFQSESRIFEIKYSPQFRTRLGGVVFPRIQKHMIRRNLQERKVIRTIGDHRLKYL